MMSNLMNNPSCAWRAAVPTQIHFGFDALNELGQLANAMGNSALLVTGGSALKTGLAERCRSLLDSSDVKVEHDASITHDPTVEQTDALVKKIQSRHFDVLIAVGGGSVLDAVKAASVVAVQCGQTEDYLAGKHKVGEGAIPVIAVPTTAGTGSELSKGAIVTWPEKKLKSGLRGDALFPRMAVVDPLLTLTLPVKQVRITGFDIFTHAVETYISRKANPLTAMISAEAIRAVCRYLPKAVADPQDKEARYHLSLHSMMVGFNLANSSTCLPHRLQYPLGALTNTAHALGLAALYPAWIKLSYAASGQRFDRIAGWMQEGLGLRAEARQDISSLLREFMQRIELTPRLTDLEVSAQHCHQMADMVSGNLENDPWWHDGVNLSNIYLAALN